MPGEATMGGISVRLKSLYHQRHLDGTCFQETSRLTGQMGVKGGNKIKW
jgi:hypothetical protein